MIVGAYEEAIADLKQRPRTWLVTGAAGSIGEIDPNTIEIGESLRVVFAPVGDVHLPRWVRAT